MKLGIAVLLLSGALAFACTPPKPKPPVPPTPVPVATNSNINTNANTNTATSVASSSSNSTASSNQTQGQQQGQTQTATGGNAASSTSNDTRIAASAIAPPVLPTVPCFKGAGGAVQAGMIGGSFGGGKVDQGCDDRELARAFSGQQTVASCKILLNTKKAKKAGITMEDCLGVQPISQNVVTSQQLVTPEPVAPVIVVEQAPMVLPQAPVVLPKLKHKVVHHLPPNCQNEIVRVCK